MDLSRAKIGSAKNSRSLLPRTLSRRLRTLIERRQRTSKAARTIDDPKTVCNVENEVPGAVTASDLARVTRKLTAALDVYNSRRLSDDAVTSAKCKSSRSSEQQSLLENLFAKVPRTPR